MVADDVVISSVYTEIPTNFGVRKYSYYSHSTLFEGFHCKKQQALFSKKYSIFSNLIRTSFCRFLKRKKKKRKLVRGSNPHLSFNRPLPTRRTDMSDDGESDE